MESNFNSEGGVPAQQAGMTPQSFLTQMKTEKDIESKKEGLGKIPVPFVSGTVEKYIRVIISPSLCGSHRF